MKQYLLLDKNYKPVGNAPTLSELRENAFGNLYSGKIAVSRLIAPPEAEDELYFLETKNRSNYKSFFDETSGVRIEMSDYQLPDGFSKKNCTDMEIQTGDFAINTTEIPSRNGHRLVQVSISKGLSNPYDTEFWKEPFGEVNIQSALMKISLELKNNWK